MPGKITHLRILSIKASSIFEAFATARRLRPAVIVVSDTRKSAGVTW
jgi:hypothetical protein